MYVISMAVDALVVYGTMTNTHVHNKRLIKLLKTVEQAQEFQVENAVEVEPEEDETDEAEQETEPSAQPQEEAEA